MVAPVWPQTGPCLRPGVNKANDRSASDKRSLYLYTSHCDYIVGKLSLAVQPIQPARFQLSQSSCPSYKDTLTRPLSHYRSHRSPSLVFSLAVLVRGRTQANPLARGAMPRSWLTWGRRHSGPSAGESFRFNRDPSLDA